MSKENVIDISKDLTPTEEHIEAIALIGEVGISCRVAKRNGEVVTDRAGKPVVNYWAHSIIRDEEGNIVEKHGLFALPVVATRRNQNGGTYRDVQGADTVNWINARLAPLTEKVLGMVPNDVGESKGDDEGDTPF